MSKLKELAAMGLLFTSASCVTAPQPGDLNVQGSCGAGHGELLWQLAEMPTNADEFRAAARSIHPYNSDRTADAAWGRHPVETWFELKTGETMLCLSSDAPHKSFGITWWTFDPVTREVTDSGATIVVG